MRNVFLTSSGLGSNAADIFWRTIGKAPEDTKVLFVPTAAVGKDSAPEGISCGNVLTDGDTLALADGQVLWIHGDTAEVIQ